MKTGLIQFIKGDNPYKKGCCPNIYLCAAIQSKRYNQRIRHTGLKRFRRFNESRVVIQVKSESPLVNKGSNLKIHANDIVPFARKRVAVAAA